MLNKIAAIIVLLYLENFNFKAKLDFINLNKNYYNIIGITHIDIIKTANASIYL